MTITKWTVRVWRLVVKFVFPSAVFPCFILQNGIRRVDSCAGTAFGEETSSDRRFKTHWYLSLTVVCLENRLYHMHVFEPSWRLWMNQGKFICLWFRNQPKEFYAAGTQKFVADVKKMFLCGKGLHQNVVQVAAVHLSWLSRN